jgi:hypothetical protein
MVGGAHAVQRGAGAPHILCSRASVYKTIRTLLYFCDNRRSVVYRSGSPLRVHQVQIGVRSIAPQPTESICIYLGGLGNAFGSGFADPHQNVRNTLE